MIRECWDLTGELRGKVEVWEGMAFPDRYRGRWEPQTQKGGKGVEGGGARGDRMSGGTVQPQRFG